MKRASNTATQQVLEGPPEPQAEARSACLAILIYLSDYPRAVDTVRGIAEWWAHTTLQATRQALDSLLAHGFLVRMKRNGHELYGRNPDLAPAELVRLRSSLGVGTK